MFYRVFKRIPELKIYVISKVQILQYFYLIKTKNSVHVLNAPSPAATSSMAIANHIVKTVKESFVL